MGAPSVAKDWEYGERNGDALLLSSTQILWKSVVLLGQTDLFEE